MPKSPGEMVAAVKANMPTKTGRSFEEWVALARSEGPTTTKECYAWLKKQHGVPHLSAQIIADKVSGKDRFAAYENGDALIEAQYSGPKANLRPIYNRLIQLARKLGKDVALTPCKTYVGLRRKRQFALVKPTTKTRVDLGVVLTDVPPQGRLEAAGNIGSDRISHVIQLASVKDIDAVVKR